MAEVQLSWAEAQQAALEGCRRRLRAMSTGRRPRYGYNNGDTWSSDIESCAAEMAVAKATNRYWAGSFDLDFDGDVGRGVQVRHTLRADGNLLLHPEDEDGHFFILVRGAIPVLDVVGGIFGHQGKQEKWWREPQPGRGCFVVPANVLGALNGRR